MHDPPPFPTSASSGAPEPARGDGPSRGWSPWLSPTPSPLDRSARERAVPGLTDACLKTPGTRVLEIRDGRVPVVESSGGVTGLAWRGPLEEDAGAQPFFLGRHDGRAHLAVRTEAAPDDDGRSFVDVRVAGPHLDPLDLDCMLTAVALVAWHTRHGFCPRCGAPTGHSAAGWVRRCSVDGSEHHPRTDPAMIVAVVDGDDRILLARNAAWDERRRSILAGFVDAGEHGAAAVAREVHEEVGVHVTDVRYVGDQPWPFPGSLMLGYTARAIRTDLTLDLDEIAEAKWYTRAELAAALDADDIRLPSRMSIARRLIEHWFGGALRSADEAEDGVRDR